MEKIDKLIKLRDSVKQIGIPTLREQTLNLLLSFISVLKPKKILEIGTAYGCSGIGMLLASPKAKLVTLEISDEAVMNARKNFKDFELSDRVEIYHGDASEIIPVISGKFDFVFIDGPKSHYLEYMPYIKELLTEDGVIFADNVLLKDYGINEPEKRNRTAFRNMQAFLEEMKNDTDFITNLIDLEDGVLIASKK